MACPLCGAEPRKRCRGEDGKAKSACMERYHAHFEVDRQERLDRERARKAARVDLIAAEIVKRLPRGEAGVWRPAIREGIAAALDKI